MSVVKKIFKCIIDILTILVFLVLILIIFAKVKMMFSATDYFELFDYSVFSVATGSMEPAISQNDIIIVKREKNYDIDEIVTFRSEDAYVTHRIVAKKGHDIVTKGDANNAKDVAITDEVIIGKVVKVLKGGGVWQKVFTTPLIMIMVFITLILFDLAFSYKGIKRKQNKKLVDKLEDVSLKEVNKKSDSPKMTNKEISELVKKTNLIKSGEDVKLGKKEKEFLNYTIRLDLNELKKQIDNKMNEDDNEE